MTTWFFQTWSSPRPKAASRPGKQDFCCLRHEPDETHEEQRQQADPRSRIFAASAADAMKPIRSKGSKLTWEAGFLPPLPLTRWNPPGAKAAKVARKQAFCCLRLKLDDKFMAILHTMANFQCMTLMRKSEDRLIIGEKDLEWLTFLTSMHYRFTIIVKFIYIYSL